MDKIRGYRKSKLENRVSLIKSKPLRHLKWTTQAMDFFLSVLSIEVNWNGIPFLTIKY